MSDDHYEMAMDYLKDQADEAMAAESAQAEAESQEQERTMVVPRIYFWDHNPPAEGAEGYPTFVTIALTEDQAREAIISHADAGELLASAELKALVLGPPTRVIEPEKGAVFVLNYAADRVEAG